MGEREGSSGLEVLRAITLGYDCCCRILMALGPAHVRGTGRAAEGFSATFGAAAAAASLARFDERDMRYAISYAVQQTSGVWSWVRDVEHIEKAFDFSGMGARNGVAGATMIQAGFTGVLDALDGERVSAGTGAPIVGSVAQSAGSPVSVNAVTTWVSDGPYWLCRAAPSRL